MEMWRCLDYVTFWVHHTCIVTFVKKFFCCCCFSVIDVYQVVGKGQNIAQTEVTMADEFAKISDKHVLKF